MQRLLPLTLVIAGCDDVIWGSASDALVLQEGYPGVQQIAEAECYACHSADAAQAQLDLQTDLHGAVVGVPSSSPAGYVLVDPGSVNTSLFYLKIANDPTIADPMPPGSTGLPQDELDIVKGWIEDGAPDQ